MFLTKEARDWCEFSPSIQSQRDHQFNVYGTYANKDLFVLLDLIFIIKKFMNLMYNSSFIGFLQHMPDRLFSCILHFHGHHHCRVVWSCYIYELVTSTKLAKNPPSLALRIPKSRPSWCMDIFWNCSMQQRLCERKQQINIKTYFQMDFNQFISWDHCTAVLRNWAKTLTFLHPGFYRIITIDTSRVFIII